MVPRTTFDIELPQHHLQMVTLTIKHADNDRQGKTYEFYRNGLVHINALYGQDVFREGNWSVVGRYNSDKQCHQAFYEAKYDHTIDGIDIKAGEWIRIEESYKYSSSQQRKLWQNAGLVPQAVFINRSGEYGKGLISHILISPHYALVGNKNISSNPISLAFSINFNV